MTQNLQFVCILQLEFTYGPNCAGKAHCSPWLDY